MGVTSMPPTAHATPYDQQPAPLGSVLRQFANPREQSPSASVTRRKTSREGLAAVTPLYKTRLCLFHSKGGCEKGATCSFAHGPCDLRVSPDFERTSLCPIMQKSGVCWKPGCRYAHNVQEIQTSTGLLKTKMCRFFSNGHCVVGGACRFAHTVEELRDAELVQSMAASAPVQILETPNARGRRGRAYCVHDNSDKEMEHSVPQIVPAPEEQPEFESALEALKLVERQEALNDFLLDLQFSIDPHSAGVVELEFSGEQNEAICKLRPGTGKYTLDKDLQLWDDALSSRLCF